MMKREKIKCPPIQSDAQRAFALPNDCVIEKRSIDEISFSRNNIRNIGQPAIDTASSILSRHGQVLPILVSRDGTVIHGHEILLAAKNLHWTHVNVVFVDGLSDTDCRILALALARIPQLSTWDDAGLRAELMELSALDLDIDLPDSIGFTEGEIDVILDPAHVQEEPDPLDAAPQPPAEQHIVTREGDTWILRQHRIMCCNSLEGENLCKLVGGRRVRMVLADPPWNVRIAGNVSGLGKVKHENFAMGVGEMTRGEFTAFLRTMLMLSVAHLVDGALVYVFMDRKKLMELLVAAEDSKLKIIDLCIWNKQTGALGGLYRGQHEPCFVFKHGDAPYLNNVQLGKHGRYRTNVWDHPGFSSFGRGRDDALAMHPTVKPVALLAEAIKDCTKRGEVVLDPFAGSGSSIIAAEKTGRVGFGIELEPKYVDVTVRRWEAMTGREAIHEASGMTFSVLRKQRAEDDQAAEPTRQIPGANLNIPEQRPAGVRIRKRPFQRLEVSNG